MKASTILVQFYKLKLKQTLTRLKLDCMLLDTKKPIFIISAVDIYVSGVLANKIIVCKYIFYCIYV